MSNALRLAAARFFAPEYIVQDFSRPCEPCYAVRHCEGEMENTFTTMKEAKALASRLNRRAFLSRLRNFRSFFIN